MVTGETYALITGSSKGLGRSMAIKLAKLGFNLFLIARSSSELSALAVEIRNQYGVDVHFLAVDLSAEHAVADVISWITSKNLPVTILINNAGYGLWGDFTSLPLANQLNMCKLNMEAVVSLCYQMLPILRKENKSYILNVASTAAYQAVPTFALYAATKTFVVSFTRALRFELKDTNVSVTCVSPGAIDTGFAQRAGLDPFSKMAEKFNMKPDEVANIAINGLLNGKSEVIPGFTNIISTFAIRLLPKYLVEKMAAGIYKT